jgi:hypothetical protein
MSATRAAAPVSDSSLIINALIAHLGSDPALLALMPNGVYYELAAKGATRYVVVSLRGGNDVAEFGRRAIEYGDYIVQAIGLSSALPQIDDMRAAAYRIDQLLEDQPFVVAGYEWMTTYRTEPINHVEPDGENRSIRWMHRGGVYHVGFAPTGATGVRKGNRS